MLKKTYLIVIIVAGALMVMTTTQVNALNIKFNPDPIDIIVGSSFTVDLLADINSGEQILGWDIDLVFDSTQVSFTGYAVGSSWNQVTAILDDDTSIAGLSGFPLPPSTGIWGSDVLLATLSFDCLAIGTSFLNISTDDSLEGFQQATPGFATWTSAAATVNQNPVPEPGTLLLFSIGLLSLAGVSRRMKKV